MVYSSSWQAWCSLCSALHNTSARASSVASLQRWWVEEAECQQLGTRTHMLVWELQKWLAG